MWKRRESWPPDTDFNHFPHSSELGRAAYIVEMCNRVERRGPIWWVLFVLVTSFQLRFACWFLVHLSSCLSSPLCLWFPQLFRGGQRFYKRDSNLQFQAFRSSLRLSNQYWIIFYGFQGGRTQLRHLFCSQDHFSGIRLPLRSQSRLRKDYFDLDFPFSWSSCSKRRWLRLFYTRYPSGIKTNPFFIVFSFKFRPPAFSLKPLVPLSRLLSWDFLSPPFP